ncbi:polysaccharide deacetylase family protein [Candidatus Poriferisocius sp.]|uniref:polysaccharide deacetylase family protein n=1 Tax=Candidatus Poriferisocius sp. TaxID=3101276 RepID=UPI003B5BF931
MYRWVLVGITAALLLAGCSSGDPSPRADAAPVTPSSNGSDEPDASPSSTKTPGGRESSRPTSDADVGEPANPTPDLLERNPPGAADDGPPPGGAAGDPDNLALSDDPQPSEEPPLPGPAGADIMGNVDPEDIEAIVALLLASVPDFEQSEHRLRDELRDQLVDTSPAVPPDGPAPIMYFTFDDGPHPVYTGEVLDVLARYDARATFFVLGSYAERFPVIIQRILDEGHTIGNHTWNHERLGGLPREQFDDTVGRTQALLGNRATTCLRPPYASMDELTRDWAAEHGLRLALWNVDPEDWRAPPALTIAQHIVDHARDGAIILLHDGGTDRSQTVLGLDVALVHLSERGYRFESQCR